MLIEELLVLFDLYSLLQLQIKYELSRILQQAKISTYDIRVQIKEFILYQILLTFYSRVFAHSRTNPPASFGDGDEDSVMVFSRVIWTVQADRNLIIF